MVVVRLSLSRHPRQVVRSPFGSAEKCLDNALEIQRIYILKSAKGQGIGSAFMQIAENFASKKKLSTIWLGVWEHNEPAKKFYKSKGYEKFSHHTFVIGDDMQTDFLLKKEMKG